MRRRALLRTVPLPLLATAGCLSGVRDLLPGNQLPSYVDREFTVVEPSDRTYDELPAVQDPPRVEFEPGDGRVVVTGSLLVGSGTCNRAGVERISYDADARLLAVEIGSERQEDAGSACTADESTDGYRLVVTFDRRFPDTVTAAEVGDPSGQTTTATR